LIASVLHRAAGLVIAADRPLPGFVLVPDASNRAPLTQDVRLHLENCPAWHAASAAAVHTAEHTNAIGQPIVTVSRSPEGFHFTYGDGTRIWVDSAGATVWCTWPPTATLEDTCTYLYGPVLGLLLRLRGALAFHASAVRIGGAAFGFVGPHGAGKSTLAAALGAAGCGVMTDDVLHVRCEGTRWIAEPFASIVKLWPDGARMALGAGSDLPPIASGWDKRALTVGTRVPGVDEPLPLAALACLAEAAASCGVSSMSPASALVRLCANSSAAHLLDGDARAAEFRALSSLVRDVPCVELTPPLDPSDYAAFVRLVLAWGRDARGQTAD
jgi:hypothetical protein